MMKKIDLPIEGSSGVRGSPGMSLRDPLCTPPGGRLGP